MAGATARYYGWPPDVVLGLKLSKLRWWYATAKRLEAQNGK